MNHGSPLTKDQRIKKEASIPKQPKPPISGATAKRIFKPLEIEVSRNDVVWLNNYVENAVRSQCLPMSLYSKDFMSELYAIFGADAKQFLSKLLSEYRATHNIAPVSNETILLSSGDEA